MKMTVNKVPFWQLLMTFAIVFMLSVPVVRAQEEEVEEEVEEEDYMGDDDVESTGTDWRQERAEIEAEIDRVVNAEVDKVITPETTVKFINLAIRRGDQLEGVGDFKTLTGTKWVWTKDGIPEPTEAISDIVEDVNDRNTARAFNEYPDEYRKVFEEEAEARYKMFALNQKVEITIRGGKGSNTLVSGYFRSLDSERVHINNQFVLRADLDEDIEAKFYPEKNKEVRERYIHRANEQYTAKRENAIYDWNQEMLPKKFIEANYVPNPAMKESNIKTSKEKYWMSKKELHAKCQKVFHDLLYAQIRLKKEPEIFAQHQYVKAENEQGEVEWMPQYEADRIQQMKMGGQQMMGPDGMPMPGMGPMPGAPGMAPMPGAPGMAPMPGAPRPGMAPMPGAPRPGMAPMPGGRPNYR